jgi:hypothetical protein
MFRMSLVFSSRPHCKRELMTPSDKTEFGSLLQGCETPSGENGATTEKLKVTGHACTYPRSPQCTDTSLNPHKSYSGNSGAGAIKLLLPRPRSYQELPCIEHRHTHHTPPSPVVRSLPSHHNPGPESASPGARSLSPTRILVLHRRKIVPRHIMAFAPLTPSSLSLADLQLPCRYQVLGFWVILGSVGYDLDPGWQPSIPSFPSALNASGRSFI